MANRKLMEFTFGPTAAAPDVVLAQATGNTFIYCEHDLSHADYVTLRLNLTKADADSGDTFIVRLQESWNQQVTWDTRAYMPVHAGDANPSATAPENYEIVIPCHEKARNADASREPDGSGGAVAVATSDYVDGPFPPIGRPTSWGTAMQVPRSQMASVRFWIAIADTGSNSDFRGSLILAADTHTYR